MDIARRNFGGRCTGWWTAQTCFAKVRVIGHEDEASYVDLRKSLGNLFGDRLSGRSITLEIILDPVNSKFRFFWWGEVLFQKHSFQVHWTRELAWVE